MLEDVVSTAPGCSLLEAAGIPWIPSVHPEPDLGSPLLFPSQLSVLCSVIQQSQCSSCPWFCCHTETPCFLWHMDSPVRSRVQLPSDLLPGLRSDVITPANKVCSRTLALSPDFSLVCLTSALWRSPIIAFWSHLGSGLSFWAFLLIGLFPKSKVCAASLCFRPDGATQQNKLNKAVKQCRAQGVGRSISARYQPCVKH